MRARSKAQGAWGQMMLAVVLMTCGAFGQTASDLGEGLRAELTGTPGVTAIKWWGKAGRTYFVQSSETLLPDSWQYMPVVESGADAVCTWNLQTSASKMFVRLVYTDQLYTGAAGDADFDGDGLSNALEVAVGWGTNPFVADTDGDGWNDNSEKQLGGDGLNALNTPVMSNTGLIDSVRSFETQSLSASDSYDLSRVDSLPPADDDWRWGQSWRLPGDVNYAGGRSAYRPSPVLHAFPLEAVPTDSHWSPTGWLSFDQSTPAEYFFHQPDWQAYALRGYNSYHADHENAWWGCKWHRHRMTMSQALPHPHTEGLLVLKWRYVKNPDFGAGGATTELRWKRDHLEEASAMLLTVPAGQTSGPWQHVLPTCHTSDEMTLTQVMRIPFTLRASPGMRFHPQSENEARDELVAGLGKNYDGTTEVDALGVLPIGLGRGESFLNAYCAPVEVYATVPQVTGISWKWKRTVQTAYWRIRFEREAGSGGPGTGPYVWKVTLIGARNTPEPDDPDLVHQDNTPSAVGRIYTGDNSGVNLFGQAVTLGIGDYYYEERKFVYSLEVTHPGGQFILGDFKVAQIMGLKRTAQAAPVNLLAPDFQGEFNVNWAGEVDLQVTESEVRAVVQNNSPIRLP